MKIIESMLKRECLKLKQVVTECELRLRNAPKGHLRIAKKKNKLEYYYIGEGEKGTKGRYLKKEKENLVKKIVQRDYDAHISKYAQERIKIIEKFLDNYEKTNLNNVYNKMNSYRKELIESPVISDEEYVKQWQSVKYEKKEIQDNGQIIVTERGEYVRSKSEKIIADKLYMLGVPYRYECPILLDGKVKVFPDFTILKMPDREEVYLEHFGMLDDPEYVSMAIYKLNTYEKNGIYLGTKLFLTYETSKKPLNVKALNEMINQLWVENYGNKSVPTTL